MPIATTIPARTEWALPSKKLRLACCGRCESTFGRIARNLNPAPVIAKGQNKAGTPAPRGMRFGICRHLNDLHSPPQHHTVALADTLRS
jgi:hypothetical protein